MITVLKFTGKKLLKLFILLCCVATAAFILVSLSPIDPVTAYVGADMMLISAAQRQIIAAKWGLDNPPVERFFKWATRLGQGDFGQSALYNEPVLKVIGERFFTSLYLMLAAWIISGLLGFFLGLVSGVKEGSFLERGISAYSYILSSAPVFWIGIVLLMVFSVSLGWTPLWGAVPAGVLPGEASLATRLHHMILPIITLALTGIARICLHTREKVKDILKKDYILYAVSRGESRCGIAVHHVLKNALLPAVSLQFASVGEIFGGAVLVEQVFAYPGLGRATVEAGIKGDVPLLLGIVLFLTVFIYLGNLAADIIYRLIDPSLRSAKK